MPQRLLYYPSDHFGVVLRDGVGGWDRLGKLFDAAIECKLAEWAAFLHDAWAGDEALRRAVEALVAQHKDADSFMEPPALEVAAKARAEV